MHHPGSEKGWCNLLKKKLTTIFILLQLSVHCQAPSIPDNGLEFEQEFYKFNEEIQFKCTVGYVLVGDADAVCQESGRFTTTTVFCAPGK